MALVFHERTGLNGRRISPFSWRIRYAFAHKGLEPEVVETRFADVHRIRALSGQHFVPIIEDGGKVVHDSWAIACHLEDAYPDRPSLFGGPIGRGVTRTLAAWGATVLAPAMRTQIWADFIWCLDPGDRAYFRESREAMLGVTLEAYCAGRDNALPQVEAACRPLDAALTEQAFLAGDAPAYADYAIFSVFQYARIGSPRDVLDHIADMPALRAWRSRMTGLFGGLGDRFALYPTQEELA
jgi:glutathione S-transferase